MSFIDVGVWLQLLYEKWNEREVLSLGSRQCWQGIAKANNCPEHNRLVKVFVFGCVVLRATNNELSGRSCL